VSGNSTLKNFKAMLASAKLPESTVEVCLRGDLVAEHQQAERDLKRAEKANSNSLAGNGSAEIAERMYLSQGTVRNYVSRLFRKLRVERRAQLVAQAARLSSTAHPGEHDRAPDP